MEVLLEIKRLAGILGLSRGELIRLMREATHNATVVSLGQLRRSEMETLLGELITIQREGVRNPLRELITA